MGKITVLSLLGGLDRPTKGDVIMDGVSISDIGGRKLRQNHVSYVFQDFKLFPYMTAVENVLLAMSISKPHMKKSEALDVDYILAFLFFFFYHRFLLYIYD